MANQDQIVRNYEVAKERYAEIGVDTEEALKNYRI